MPDVSIQSLDAVIQFRSHLVTFNRDIDNAFKAMRSHARSIGQDWNDGKYRAFIDTFEEVAAGIERYLAVTDDHERYLGALIERVRSVLDTTL